MSAAQTMRGLAASLHARALELVPQDYKMRDMANKYLKMDNYAAGLDDSALELDALADTLEMWAESNLFPVTSHPESAGALDFEDVRALIIGAKE